MPLLTTLIDNFNDNVIGPNWGNSYGGVSEVGGRARIPLVAGTYAGFQTGKAWTFAEASVYLKLVTLPIPGGGTNVTFNFHVVSPTEGTSLGFQYKAVTGMLRMEANVAYWDEDAVEIPYSATDHLWLQVRETAGTVYWDTSPDGSTWTNRRTLATPTWVTSSIDTCALDLWAYREAGTTDYTEVDNVNTLSDGAVVTATGNGTMTTTATATAARTATATGTSTLNTTTAAAARAIYHATGHGSIDTDATATAAGGSIDTSDIDFAVGAPSTSWAVSVPWR